MMGTYGFRSGDYEWIAAQVVLGIGSLGAHFIMKHGRRVSGLKTAAGEALDLALDGRRIQGAVLVGQFRLDRFLHSPRVGRDSLVGGGQPAVVLGDLRSGGDIVDILMLGAKVVCPQSLKGPYTVQQLQLHSRVIATLRLFRCYSAARVEAACQLAVGKVGKARTATIRAKLVNGPARIASSARGIRLHLPEAWPWQQAWEKLFAAVHALPQ